MLDKLLSEFLIAEPSSNDKMLTDPQELAIKPLDDDDQMLMNSVISTLQHQELTEAPRHNHIADPSTSNNNAVPHFSLFDDKAQHWQTENPPHASDDEVRAIILPYEASYSPLSLDYGT